MYTVMSASISHRDSGVDEIEKARFGDVAGALLRLSSYGEAMILQTCNRVEVYVVVEEAAGLKRFLSEEGLDAGAFEVCHGEKCLRRMMRLACGLESMVVGEDQILGQIKDAYILSEKQGVMGRTLSTAVLRAVAAGKRARRETRINKGSVSIGSAAVDLAESMLGDLRDKEIMVVGAGEMGALVATSLASRGLKGIYVANRTYEQACRLASGLGGTAIRLDDIGEYLGSADVLICATAAPHIIVSRVMVEAKLHERRGKKLLIIDITNPRNVEESVSEIPCVELHNIDSLRGISDQNMGKRLEEIPEVERIIEEEMSMLEREYRRMSADRLIGSIYRKTDNLRKAELSRAIARLSASGSLSGKQVEILNEFSAALTGKILATPAERLRQAAETGDEQYVKLAKEMFDLEEVIRDGLSGDEAEKAKTE